MMLTVSKLRPNSPLGVLSDQTKRIAALMTIIHDRMNRTGIFDFMVVYFDFFERILVFIRSLAVIAPTILFADSSASFGE
jgi:hypothetical protein